MKIPLLINPIKLFKLIKDNIIYRFTYRYHIYNRRLLISNELNKEFNGTVKYGKFKGFKLGTGYNWGKADLAGMLLGLYEFEILESLILASKNKKFLIDIGAADGYFAIGSLVSNLFTKTICYEISPQSRINLDANAKINGVRNRLEIFGEGKSDFYNQIIDLGIELSQCVILCDIEGGEFSLFSDVVLKNLKDSIIIIEIHDWHINGFEEYNELKTRASQYFEVQLLTTKSRDLSVFPEIAHLSDNDRWLICSEGRHKLTTWLQLSPKIQFAEM